MVKLNLGDAKQMQSQGFFSEVDFLSGKTVIKKLGGSIDDINNNSQAELMF